ncbi:MAG: lipoprotein [Xanthomonadales bacterium]|nr:lipoprotein [Xanthomonadales bacterium]
MRKLVPMLLLLLAGCGNRGDLYLPPEDPPPEPEAPRQQPAPEPPGHG